MADRIHHKYCTGKYADDSEIGEIPLPVSGFGYGICFFDDMYPKTELQEWAQGRGMPLPSYRIAHREGPDHAPTFTLAVSVAEGLEAIGIGSTRRAAEQAAAGRAGGEGEAGGLRLGGAAGL